MMSSSCNAAAENQWEGMLLHSSRKIIGRFFLFLIKASTSTLGPHSMKGIGMKNVIVNMVISSKLFLSLIVYSVYFLNDFVSSIQQFDSTLGFSITSRKNQTGHIITEIELDKSATHLPEVWKANFKQSFSEKDGIQEYYIKGVVSAKPPTPRDYELFPGVGYYKFHTDFANGFEDASSRCAQEGGHLAIVNSESEHQVLSTMFARFPESELKTVWAFVGFHDRFKEGEYVTIYGEPLNTTGFTRWSSAGQPDNYNGAEDCGSVHRNGGLNDIGCNANLPFFCEYDLTW